MELPLDKGVTLIDDEDYEKIKPYHWYITDGYVKGYLASYPRSYKRVAMHRIIMDCSADKIIDHINANTLDNRKINLRICNHSQNEQNSKKK